VSSHRTQTQTNTGTKMICRWHQFHRRVFGQGICVVFTIWQCSCIPFTEARFPACSWF